MGFKGDLTSISLPDVFQTLAMAGKDGTLVLADGDRSKSIFFGKGFIRLVARTPAKADLLANLLLQAGSCTSEQIASALGAAKSGGRGLGEVLADMGFATQDEIDLVMRSQVEEELYDIFWWHQAHFEFFDGPMPDDQAGEGARPRALQFEVNGLLFEAARRLDEWGRMVQAIPDFSATYLVTDEGRRLAESGEITDPGEIAVLRLCDGSLTVDRMIEQSSLPRFDTVRFLYEGLNAGKVHKAEVADLQAAAVRLREEGEKPRALGVLRGALALAADDLGLLEMAATLEEEVDRKTEAAATWLRLATQAKLQGDAKRATTALEHAARCDPANLEAQLALCRHLADTGAKDRAEEIAKPLASQLAAAKRLEEARDLCVWAAGFAREPLDLQVVQARALLDLKNREGARHALTKAVNALAGKESKRYEVLQRRIYVLAGDAPDLMTIAQGMAVQKAKSNTLTKLAVAGVLLLVALGGAGWWYQQQQVQARLAFDAARQQADQLAAEKKWGAARDVLRQVETQYGFTSIPKQVAEAIAGIDAQEREEARRVATEQAALADARKKALEERRNRLEKAAELERVAPSLEQPLEIFTEIERWAGENGAADLAKIATAGRERVQARLDAAAAVAREAAERASADDVPGAYAKVKELWQKHGRTPAARDAKLPIKVVTLPPGAVVKLGRAEAGRSPVVLSIPSDAERLTLLVEYTGFLPFSKEITHDSEPVLSLTLEKLVASRYRTKGPIEGRPAVQDGRVYFGSRDGHLYAVKTADFSLAWSFATADGGDIIGSPTLHGDSVYVGSNDKKVYRVALDTGKEKWRYATGLFVQCTPLVLDDPAVVIVGSHDGKLHGIHRDTGKGLWTVPTGGPVTGRPVAAGNAVLFVSQDATLRAIDPLGGKLLWSLPCGSDLLAAPVVDGDRAFVGTKAGQVFAIDLTAHKVAWTFPGGSTVTRPVAVSNGSVYFGNANGWVFALQRDNGKERWRVDLKSPVTGGIALYEDLIVVGARDGNLHVLHRDDGAPQWRLQTRGPVNGIPALDESMLYVGSDDGQLYATDLRSSAR